ncbi:MAG: zinc ribbon domain-containing protein [Candidatus Omnitrophica bacterium]|nr:zinc ribbon domain-containing protein [Candidatus Omnitrophota bacterium]
MPNYDYECGHCGIFEKFQAMSDAPLARCPKCKGPVKRLISGGAGVIFKGTGFYATDYRAPQKPESKDCGKPKEKGSCSGGNSCGNAA